MAYQNRIIKKVQSVTLEYEYTIQRAVMIDPLNEYNLIRISVINPFFARLNDLKFTVLIHKLQKLRNENIRIPPFSTITNRQE